MKKITVRWYYYKTSGCKCCLHSLYWDICFRSSIRCLGRLLRRALQGGQTQRPFIAPGHLVIHEVTQAPWVGGGWSGLLGGFPRDARRVNSAAKGSGGFPSSPLSRRSSGLRIGGAQGRYVGCFVEPATRHRSVAHRVKAQDRSRCWASSPAVFRQSGPYLRNWLAAAKENDCGFLPA